MAYSLIEESQVNHKSLQYYPEEYEYPVYSNRITEEKQSYPIFQNTKKVKKSMPSVNYINERKCPIYVHQFNKLPSSNTFHDYSKSQEKNRMEKHSPKTGKTSSFQSSKSMLDKLEESYWATWKPNKESSVGKLQKSGKNKAYGDVDETFVKYFIGSGFKSSEVTVDDNSDIEKYRRPREIPTNSLVFHSDNSVQKVETSTQEIQTDAYPILTKIEEKFENEVEIKEIIDYKNEVTPITLNNKATKSKNNIEEEESDKTTEDSKLLKHTDSIIINKKKQSEVKEHYQQPKCIKLYKKASIKTGSFLKGGSYPLKSCLKQDPVPKGNFRLGAPGSPLFVTSNSFNKKYRK